MQAFSEFQNVDPSFWALVKYISETLGYTDRKTKSIRTYTVDSINKLLDDRSIALSDTTILMLRNYFDKRAVILNGVVRDNLMDAGTAKTAFERLLPIYCDNDFVCKLPMNKQSGAMKRINYFTAIINILAEKTIRESSAYNGSLGFDDDPHGLAYVLDESNRLVGASSRRFDGAYPSLMNPKIIWEVKE